MNSLSVSLSHVSASKHGTLIDSASVLIDNAGVVLACFTGSVRVSKFVKDIIFLGHCPSVGAR